MKPSIYLRVASRVVCPTLPARLDLALSQRGVERVCIFTNAWWDCSTGLMALDDMQGMVHECTVFFSNAPKPVWFSEVFSCWTVLFPTLNPTP